MVMMFVIVVMSASALAIMIMVMMLMFVVMVASALVVVVVMMMFMLVVMIASALVIMIMVMVMFMIMIVMSTAYRAEIFVFFSSLLHRFQDLCTVQFFDRSGDEHCVFVHFTDQSDCFCYFLLRSLRCIGTAQNNRSCIL